MARYAKMHNAKQVAGWFTSPGKGLLVLTGGVGCGRLDTPGTTLSFLLGTSRLVDVETDFHALAAWDRHIAVCTGNLDISTLSEPYVRCYLYSHHILSYALPLSPKPFQFQSSLVLITCDWWKRWFPQRWVLHPPFLSLRKPSFPIL